MVKTYLFYPEQRMIKTDVNQKYFIHKTSRTLQIFALNTIIYLPNPYYEDDFL